MTLEELLIRHEGLKLKPYICTAGKYSIGVGRNLEDQGISKDEAMVLLRTDIARCQREATDGLPWYESLSNVRKQVVISMIFNVGFTRFLKFSKMIAAIEAKNFDLAAAEMLNSLWANQVGKRSEELANMMASDQPIE